MVPEPLLRHEVRSAMTKLSDLVPLIPGQLHGGVLIREEGHFYNCPNCGQKVDQRDLRQVFWHEEGTSL